MSTPRRARVVVVEQLALVAETFGLALSEFCDARAVIAQHHSTTESVAAEVLRARPDVVFLDLDLGLHIDAQSLVESLAGRGLAVLVLTTRSSDDVRRGECLQRGAVGALGKEDGLAPVMLALKRALARQPVMDPDEARQLLSAAHNAKAADLVGRQRLAKLTTRESEVLERLMAGDNATEIARSSFVSEATVRTQIKSILAKLEVGSQIAAVAIAYRYGWKPAVPADR